MAVRIVPARRERPLPRVFWTSTDGSFELQWSQVLSDGRAVNELAQQTQREYEVRGWQLEPLPIEDVGAPH